MDTQPKDAGYRVIDCLRKHRLNGGSLFGAGTGAHDTGVFRGKGLIDRDQVVGLFSGTVDDLAKAGAHLAVMIELGKAEVLIGQVFEQLAGGFDLHTARLHLLQNFLKLHQHSSSSKRGTVHFPQL